MSTDTAQSTEPASAPGTEINKKLGFVSIFVSATGMALVGTLGRLATPVDPVSGQRYVIGDFLAGGRMITGAIGMLLIIALVHKWPKLRTTRLSFAVVAGGFCIGTSLALYVSATLMTSIANAVFLIYTGPLFSAILARIVLKERIAPLQAFFFGLVFLGMLMTIGIIQYTPETGLHVGLDLGVNPEFPQKIVGDAFGLGSGLFYGLALFFYRYRPDIESEVRGFWNFVFGAVGALVVMVLRMTFLDSTNPLAVMTPKNWAWASVLFVLCGLVAIGFLVVAGKHLSAIELSTTAYWECAVALLLGLIVWGESMTVIGMIGGLLIIIGGLAPVLMTARRPRAHTPRADGEPQATEAGPTTTRR